MEAKKEKVNLAGVTGKQTFIQLTIEVFLSIIFGDIVTKLVGGLVLIIIGPIIYIKNSELTIGAVIGIAFPLIGILVVVSEIRDIIKEIKKKQKTKPDFLLQKQ